MIQLFRKIRKSSLTNGKLINYLLYAFGEIFLVVIGILLAIQINQWNQKRIVEKQNQAFLVKLLDDLYFNKNRMYKMAYEEFDDFDNGLPSIEGAISEGKIILDLAYIGLKEGDIEFLNQSRFHSGTVRMNVNRNTYEEILNIGRLNSLGSDTLVSGIIEYYQYCERMDEYNLENTKFVLEGLDLMEQGLHKLLQDYRMNKHDFNMNSYGWYFNKNSTEYQNMQIALGSILAAQERKLNQANHFIEETNSIIKLVENEIKEKQKANKH